MRAAAAHKIDLRWLASQREPRELPAYSIPEAAHYLQIPQATLRSWVLGRLYPTESGKKQFLPIIEVPLPGHPVLSFVNLVEAHVLDAVRRQHEVSLKKVRRAIRFLKDRFHSNHPLADQTFETDGLDLFIQEYGQLIAISEGGQLAMRNLIEAHLKRIERDPSGVAVRLYPFTRKRHLDEPKFIVIDPAVSFGRPILQGTGISTAVVAGRYKAGESIEELADDYGRGPHEIQEAIRCELEVIAA